MMKYISTQVLYQLKSQGMEDNGLSVTWLFQSCFLYLRAVGRQNILAKKSKP